MRASKPSSQRFENVAAGITYNVWPRYTPGSPALVRDATAQQVMRAEQSVYADMVKGLYGDAKKEEATRLGLRGIVEEIWEFRGILMYRDLITGETGSKPLCAYCGKRHAVGKNGRDAYEPHPDELRYHPDMDEEYWASGGGN
jgi:hypothetical protein